MPLGLSLLLPKKHPDNIYIYIYIYICYFSKNSQYYGVPSENKSLFFNLLFGCPKEKFDLDVLNKKNYILTMILLQPTYLQMLELLYTNIINLNHKIQLRLTTHHCDQMKNSIYNLFIPHKQCLEVFSFQQLGLLKLTKF